MPIYTVDPDGYGRMRRILAFLPSDVMKRYVISINQVPGINHRNLQWMMLAAQDQKVRKLEKSGLLLFDEVPIKVT